jgi:hypothetical protein
MFTYVAEALEARKQKVSVCLLLFWIARWAAFGRYAMDRAQGCFFGSLFILDRPLGGLRRYAMDLAQGCVQSGIVEFVIPGEAISGMTQLKVTDFFASFRDGSPDAARRG